MTKLMIGTLSAHFVACISTIHVQIFQENTETLNNIVFLSKAKISSVPIA